MKVVILAGGRGSRMRDETNVKPKPMIRIGGRPILWHIMKGYAHYGFKEFVICLGYKGEVIKEFFLNYEAMTRDVTLVLGRPRQWEVHGANVENDWRVTLADTGEFAQKGARIKKIESYIDGDVFLLTYGDGVANVNIDRLLAFHRQHGRIATVTGVRPPSRFGELLVERERVLRFTEKPQTAAGLINGGYFVLDRKIFGHLSAADDCDFERGVLQELARAGELMVYIHEDGWECMDTYRDIEYLNDLWESGRAFWKSWT